MVDQSDSVPIAGQPGGTNASWQTTFISKASWCRLGREDLVRIRAEQAKFIGQSSIPEAARIEWYLTWPAKSVRVPKESRRHTNRSARLIRSRQELRATEVGDGIWKVSGAPALDAIVNSISEYEGRRPRALRHLEISAFAPGYRTLLRVGGPSRISPRTTIICETPGTQVPESFHSISGIIAKRAMSFMAMMRLSIWLLTFLIIIMLPTAVVPIFYIHFQHAKNRDSITAAAFWATIGYLIAVAFMVGFSLYLTAARVVLPRVGRFEGMRAVFSRAARHLGWSDPSTFGPVRRQLAFVGGGLAGAGLTAMLAYVVATASTNARNAPTWPYGLFGALMAVGAFFYLVGVVHFRRRTQGEGKDTV